MFSQRRKKYKNMVFISVLVAVVILMLVALLGYLGSFRDKNVEESAVNDMAVPTEETRIIEENTVDVNEAIEQSDAEQDLEVKKETYYLVKYDNDVIRIFFSDHHGELTELEETDIVYETLSVEDQVKFEEGIKASDRDQLNRLLMDYES